MQRAELRELPLLLFYRLCVARVASKTLLTCSPQISPLNSLRHCCTGRGSVWSMYVYALSTLY
jgi:hypothetical protein